MARTAIIAGNWKMHKSPEEAVAFVQELAPMVQVYDKVERVVAPTFLALGPVSVALEDSSLKVAAQDAQLVVWPEASGWVDPLSPTGQALARQVAGVAARSDTTIVWPYFIRLDNDRTRNEAVLVYPNGRLSAPTTKAHPVWVIGERSITEGLHPVYTVDGVAVGLALGPDGSYTDALARLARDGAQVVAVPTHDWAAYAGTQLAHLRVRAAEHRLAIVKADWRYGSAIVSPDGSIVEATPLATQLETMLVADVAVTTPGSPYSVSGDWLGVVSLVVAVGAVAAAVVTGRVGHRRSS
jgi:predicted amidohydrolase